MLKLTYILIFFFLISESCDNRRICRIDGNIKNIKDSTMLFLTDLDSSTLIDSILVVNGSFNHEIHLTHPVKFLLHNKRNQYQNRDRKIIWLEPSNISIKGDFNFIKSMEIEGSNSHKEYFQFSLIVDRFSRQISKSEENLIMDSLDIQDRIKEGANIPDRNKEHQRLKMRLNKLKEELTNRIIEYLNSNLNSYVSLSTLYNESSQYKRHLNKEQIKMIYEKLPEKLKTSNEGLKVKKYIDLPIVPKIGGKALDIIQSSPIGDTIKLSDYKGKYVFVDFWASGCGPCRGEFKGLKEIYKKYHPLGLEIIGVSGDRKKKDWVAAITHDSLPWINISDLKGWENEAFLLYEIRLIPSNILVDKKGIIIGKDYRGSYRLDKVLRKIFKNENGL